MLELHLSVTPKVHCVCFSLRESLNLINKTKATIYNRCWAQYKSTSEIVKRSVRTAHF